MRGELDNPQQRSVGAILLPCDPASEVQRYSQPSGPQISAAIAGAACGSGKACWDSPVAMLKRKATHPKMLASSVAPVSRTGPFPSAAFADRRVLRRARRLLSGRATPPLDLSGIAPAARPLERKPEERQGAEEACPTSPPASPCERLLDPLAARCGQRREMTRLGGAEPSHTCNGLCRPGLEDRVGRPPRTARSNGVACHPDVFQWGGRSPRACPGIPADRDEAGKELPSPRPNPRGNDQWLRCRPTGPRRTAGRVFRPQARKEGRHGQPTPGGGADCPLSSNTAS